MEVTESDRGTTGLAEILNNPETINSLRKLSQKWEECKKTGHPNSTYLGMSYNRGNLRVRAHCNDCGFPYERLPTIDESRRFLDFMHTPFTSEYN